MKAQLKAALQALGLYEAASRAWIATEPRLIRASRAITGRDRRLIDRHLLAHAPKLHIGCGDNELAGWLNTELCPHGEQIFLDATAPFPFANGTFAFIYSEHMIEHVPLRGARAMLAECVRVMRPGGVIRIVTPDLESLTALLAPEPSLEVSAYIRYAIDAHRIDAPAADGVAVFNHFMRAWGHQFIHTERSLRALMNQAGFCEVQRQPLNQSPHAELAGLAKVDRMPAGFLELESFVLEGRTPLRS